MSGGQAPASHPAMAVILPGSYGPAFRAGAPAPDALTREAPVIVRLIALYVGLRGVLGLVGFFALQRAMGAVGMMGMAGGAALTLVAAGAVLFLAAPILARAVTFDLS